MVDDRKLNEMAEQQKKEREEVLKETAERWWEELKSDPKTRALIGMKLLE